MGSEGTAFAWFVVGAGLAGPRSLARVSSGSPLPVVTTEPGSGRLTRGVRASSRQRPSFAPHGPSGQARPERFTVAIGSRDRGGAVWLGSGGDGEHVQRTLVDAGRQGDAGDLFAGCQGDG